MNTVSGSTKVQLSQPLINQAFISKVKEKKTEQKDFPVISAIETPEEKKQFSEILDLVSDMMFGDEIHYEFQVHEKTGKIMSKLINTDTGEVVREIPPEKILDVIAGLWEIAGIIIDDKA